MSALELTAPQYLEFEKLGLGAYAPLDGFMNEAEFLGAVDNMRLPNGSVFPLPVVLDVSAADAARLKGLARVALTYCGEEVGELRPESAFTCDKEAVAHKIFATADRGHPGVRNFLEGGDSFLGGPVQLHRRARLAVADFELTPEQARAEFQARGWRTVAGFQTRNVPHRAHEHLQRSALDRVDGLFIQPLIGRRRAGDFTAEAIMTGYRVQIERFLPPGRVVLAGISASMRYAGPREAVFHAIIRRNYGCTHFIVGRDHAGVDGYYGRYEAQDLACRLEAELGIAIMCMNGPYYSTERDAIVNELREPDAAIARGAAIEISATDMRRALAGGEQPDPRFMRPEVVESLRGVELFVAEGET